MIRTGPFAGKPLALLAVCILTLEIVCGLLVDSNGCLPMLGTRSSLALVLGLAVAFLAIAGRLLVLDRRWLLLAAAGVLLNVLVFAPLVM